MNNKEFKVIFGKIAKEYGFLKAYGGWYKQSDECIAILELQKSNYGDYYMLRGKIFVQGSFGSTYTLSKDLIKSSLSDLGFDETPEYRSIFNFDQQIDDTKRIEDLGNLFKCHIVPFSNKGLSKNGIMELINYDKVPVLSVVKEELKKLIDKNGRNNEVDN
eukprot:TRINITY_DN42946_c0_g1_i1.p1 TRINITY_DN42946_c0_g1~~TRINITY_DN42946_c0_g1_i1.p1  ORF type:complete len:161 (+),score=18.46 TRINITY_DN42946_c0_g1_i1:430-912(+)